MRSFVQREFLGSTREDDERNWRIWTKAKAWGCPHGTPWIIKKTQASKLGDSQGIPSSSSTTIRFYHFTYYVLFLERHFILLSVCFNLFAGHVLFWILAILCGRETRSAYILFSILSFCFCYQLLSFAYIFLRAVSCCY